jgi:hypothetical protein
MIAVARNGAARDDDCNGAVSGPAPTRHGACHAPASASASLLASPRPAASKKIALRVQLDGIRIALLLGKWHYRSAT